MPEIFGALFARGGSKGLPGKNLRLLGGQSLVARAVRAGLGAASIDRMIVSTDDPAIAREAEAHGAQVLFMRPAELAGDTAPEILAWQHAIREVERIDGRRPEIMVSVPATAPLRSSADIDACVRRLLDSGADLAITVTESPYSPWFTMVRMDDDGRVRTLLTSDPPLTRRQDAPPVYGITPVAYAVRCEYLLAAGAIMEGDVVATVVPRERAIDIDTELDLVIAEAIAGWSASRGCERPGPV